MKKYILTSLLSIFAFTCCHRPAEKAAKMEYAQWFSLEEDAVVVYSPFGAAPDTLRLPLCEEGALPRLVCMSSSYVGFLQALGAEDAAVAVSGLKFLDGKLQAIEVGYEAALDYEAILGAKPDLYLDYSLSAAEAPSHAKLRELGIPVLLLHEHLESHPLARAEYVKLFGALIGRRALADSLFAAIRDHYLSLVVPPDVPRRKILVNIPYAEQWFIPGGDNYLTRLMEDAGGEVLGAVPGAQTSSTISLETAYQYAQKADIWLHPGWCRSKEELRSMHPLFAHFPVLDKPVWNNTLQATPGGGNAFWQSGPVRPDLVLEDLRAILTSCPAPTGHPMHYYIPVR